MRIHHRYLPFHTRLVRGKGKRTSDGDVHNVFENEIVVDVGGSCRGWLGETLWVLDHHFHRGEGNFPSASAAVLHHAPEIFDGFGRQSEVWIATHADPDFDAFCASYLVRSLLLGELAAAAEGWAALGIHPDGWQDPADANGGNRCIDWFQPRVPEEDPRRWAVLLAAYASCIDQGKVLRCARNKAMHAVLYAGLVRGRDFHRDGAAAFFDEARSSIQSRSLNPLFDALFRVDGTFGPELELLSREADHYVRDIARARRSVVTVPVSRTPFAEWFGKLQQPDSPPALVGEPGADLRVNPEHLALVPVGESRSVDAVHLRDPECILFKEWARQDFENSPLGKGFTFTAVAYSNERSGATRGNLTNYYFALDPERADGAHLYPLWLSLQRREIEARFAAGFRGAESATARRGFEQRAGSLRGWFDDPWYDGQNFHATIVPTPNDGTAIPPGLRPDLADDAVAEIAIRELEFGMFAKGAGDERAVAEVVDFSCAPEGGESARSLPIEGGVEATLCPSCLRFVSARLKPGVDLEAAGVAEQVGRLLWPFLEVEGVRGVPVDFLANHLCVHPGHVVVWNRRGAAIALVNGAREPDRTGVIGEGPDRGLHEDLRNLASLIGGIQRLVNDHGEKDHRARAASLIEDGQGLLRQLANLKLRSAAPEKRAFREILRRSGCDDSVGVVHALNVRAADEEEGRRDKELQRLISGVFLVLGIPAFVLGAVEAIGRDAFGEKIPGMPDWIASLATNLGLEGAGPWGQFILGLTISAVLFGTGLWLIWAGILSAGQDLAARRGRVRASGGALRGTRKKGLTKT